MAAENRFFLSPLQIAMGVQKYLLSIHAFNKNLKSTSKNDLELINKFCFKDTLILRVIT